MVVRGAVSVNAEFRAGACGGLFEAPESTAPGGAGGMTAGARSKRPSWPCDGRSKCHEAPRQAVRPPGAYLGFCRGRYDSPSTTSSEAAFLRRSTAVWARSGSASMANHSAGSRFEVTIIEPALCRSTVSS